MRKNDSRHSTNVKIDATTFEAFKVKAAQTNLNFQKLADRAMWLYLNDDEFADKIRSTNNLEF